MSALLVTGASGFIGQAVLQALRAAAPGMPLLLAGRRAGALPAGCAFVPLDLAGPAIALPAGIGTVLHLAGEKRDARPHGCSQPRWRRAAGGGRRAGPVQRASCTSAASASTGRRSTPASSPKTSATRHAMRTNAARTLARWRCAHAAPLRASPAWLLQPSNVFGVLPGRSHPLLGLVRMVARGWFRFSAVATRG